MVPGTGRATPANVIEMPHPVNRPDEIRLDEGGPPPPSGDKPRGGQPPRRAPQSDPHICFFSGMFNEFLECSRTIRQIRRLCIHTCKLTGPVGLPVPSPRYFLEFPRDVLELIRRPLGLLGVRGISFFHWPITPLPFDSSLFPVVLIFPLPWNH